MPLQATSGAASYDAFGGGVAAVPNYIEDVFSTWLYTGADSSTITNNNGIDLTGKGGLVWIKTRSGNGGAQNHALFDTVRGSRPYLSSNTTTAQTNTNGASDFAFLSNGFQVGPRNGTDFINASSTNFASWTFREQSKFFDIVTYTGNGVSNRAISHNLGSVPGCIIVKRTDTTGDWFVNHFDAAGSTERYLFLNSTSQADTSTILAGGYISAGTSTTFRAYDFGTGMANVNASGGTYVAYLFAHNAGGFGLTGTDNVISCGSYTGTGSTQQQITLGYEPQWVMIKRTDTANSWIMVDNMRGFFQAADNALCANNANTEAATVSVSGAMQPTATGFSLFNANSAVNASGGTYIYIAIRRGPMKVPTTGTSVFNPYAATNTQPITFSNSWPTDFVFTTLTNTNDPNLTFDRLRGSNRYLNTASTAAETTAGSFGILFDASTGNLTSNIWAGANSGLWYAFRRAPGFFDEVCYTGTSSVRTVAHNLTVVPELMIVKKRSGVDVWGVWNKSRPLAGDILYLNLTIGWDNNAGYFNSTNPTSSVFSVGVSTSTNSSGETYVAYLFATCPGVSKVGSFTGTGATQVVNCGFTGGARFVLIKATSTTGDWYVWDSARGIVAGNDPYLRLNSTAAEVTNTDWVDTAATGFELSNAGGNLANSNGVSYIFLAIA